MLLYKALQRADCPICLLPLRKRKIEKEDAASQLSFSSAVLHKTPVSDSDPEFRILRRDGIPNPSALLGHSGDGNDPDSERPPKRRRMENDGDEGDPSPEGVVVLRCGHFLHVICATQLFEFASAKSACVCPICRTAIPRGSLATDVVRFSPHTRPCKVGAARPAGRARVVDESGGHTPERIESAASTAGGDPDEDANSDALFVGSAQVAPSRAYADQLGRCSNHYKARYDNLTGRVHHLQASLRQLEEDCTELERTVRTLRQQREVIAGRGTEQRLMELRQLSLEAKRSCDNLTAELAASTREEQRLREQIDKYRRKLKRFS